MLHTHKQACTSFTGLPYWRKLLSPSFLALNGACICFTVPPRPWKRRCRVFPAHKQVCTIFTRPTAFTIGCFPHINRFTPAAQDLLGGENFLHLCWHFHRPARASQPHFGGENGVVWWFPHIHRLAPASQDLYSCENCFINLFWHINRTARASQHHLRG